jgi:hypothetical protein
METLNVNLSLTFEQVVAIVSQLPKSEQLKLSDILQKEAKKEKDPIQTHLVSQAVLTKDWLNQAAEEEAWRHL